MRNNNLKTQNTQLPSLQGRANEINKIPATSENLKKEISELFSSIGSSHDISEMMRDILKASIGNNEASGDNAPSEIGLALWRVDALTKFVRTLGNHLPTEPTHDEILLIAELYERIDYERFSDYIFDGLCKWVFDEGIGLACLEYVAKVANSFQQVSELLEACEIYSTVK